MVQVHEQQTISASPERVFDWLLDPANLAVSPMFRNVVWAKDWSGPCVGATREVTGFGFWAHGQITAYDPPRSYSNFAIRSSRPPNTMVERSRALRRATARMSIG
jgi:uncharacterized protein YndB with AHSA1/START domain